MALHISPRGNSLDLLVTVILLAASGGRGVGRSCPPPKFCMSENFLQKIQNLGWKIHVWRSKIWGQNWTIEHP